MLSGEGNARERWKTKIGLISKQNNFARAAHFFCTFPCRCFARLQRRPSRNFFMEEMSYVFSFTFFYCRSFSPCMGGRGHFSFHFLLPALQNFQIVLPTKNVSCVFLSLALDLCRAFWRWVSLAFRLLSLFLCLSLSLYSKFVGMTINLSLIL